MYVKGLRLIWWNKGTDALLSFFPFWFITVPFLLLLSIVESIRFTYLYVKKDSKVHSYYIELIDYSGVYKCYLHNEKLRDNSCNQEVVFVK